MTTTEKRRPYSPDEALEALGHPVSRGTFYKAIQQGQVPHWKLGKRIFIAPATVEDMLSGRRAVTE